VVNLIHVITPAPRDTWVEVLNADAEALITQTPDWLICIRRAGAYTDASRLYLFDDGRRIVLPFARRQHRPPALATEGSWPFDWGIGGPLVDGPVDTGHTRGVYADLLSHPALARTLRTGPCADPAWRTAPPLFHRTKHTTQIVDLAGGFETVWSTRFRSSVRRAIRKAERANLHVEVDRTGRLIPVFYDLYQQSIQRWAAQQHEPLPLARWRAHRANPLRKFHTVADQLGDRCAVWVAWQAGEPVAALIVLRHLGQAKYWRGAMNSELASPTRANDLLHRLAIEDACQAGCSRYHMGDSRPGSGLAAFKAGFGAQPYLSHSYRAERIPLSAMDHQLRALAKRALRFRDA
jgi:hypothetical protein